MNIDPWGNAPQASPTDKCSYYDDVARQSKCKYHAGDGGRFCRNPKLNWYFWFWSDAKLDVIRSCLIEEDEKARSDPKSQPCNKPGCVKRSKIVEYHKKCFEQNGASFAKGFWGGYYPFDNDGDK